MVWYCHLFKNFPVCGDPHKGFDIVNKTEIDVILELSCFFDNAADVGNLSSSSSLLSINQLEQLEVHGSRIAEAWLGEF